MLMLLLSVYDYWHYVISSVKTEIDHSHTQGQGATLDP